MEKNHKLPDSLSRRSFLIKGSLAAAGLVLMNRSGLTQTVYLNEKPNSRFFGVQIGVITYSYRSMPHDIHQLLKYVVDSGISAIELMGDPVEIFAGRPADPQQVAGWRASVSMDKFKEIKRMY